MRLLLALLSLVMLAAGCGGDAVVLPPGGNIGGIYTLRTVNGNPLPYVYYEDVTEKYEILDDSITLSDIGSWTRVSHERGTVKSVATVVTFRDAGSFTRQGSTILLSSGGGRSLAGTLNGNDLVFTGLRSSVVYTR